jgi:hypothetical protein
VHVTRHFGLTNAAIADQVWDLYAASYQRVVGRTVTHEMLYRHEFDDVVRDPSNRLWVLWNDRQPVACTLIATDVGSTGYISREYFEQRYPEFVAEHRVRYMMWTVVHPDFMARGVLVRLAREVLAVEADEGSIIVFDSPEINQPSDRGGSAEMMARLVKLTSNGSTVEQVEVQRYFLADFSKGVRYLERVGGAAVALSA